MLVILLQKNGDSIPIDDTSFPFSALIPMWNSVGGIILKYADHVVEVNERVTNGNNIHFARVRPDNQAPSVAKTVHSDLHHNVPGMRLALHEKMPFS